ncbi:MAG TPA: efflux RND transporter periplasmic adaptor subunit [Vicinamibacteria bacterium]|nr:efflux RND transporter periplasmic adaptor subunit [Vicinamibacteria bacterium]
MGKRTRILLVGGAGVVVLGGILLGFRSRGSGPRYATAVVDRGDISDVVGATGLLQAVITVQVGSQVSGTIASLGADFNSVVKKNQVIARLDPALFEARVEQMKANLASSHAAVERNRAAVADAKQKYERSRQLAATNLIPASDLESAKAAYDGAVAAVGESEAAVTQAKAALNQAQLDLAHSVIQAPIDGVVLARNVDVGQTVAASFQAPVLFVIANDLTQMQVNASVDEADIGRVRPGEAVSFHVDAYPDQSFMGKVDQVRLQPITNQNVVTYNTMITVGNKDLRLMPGMTATVSVIIQDRENALRFPSPALRFRPDGFLEEKGARKTPSGTAGAAAPARSGRPSPPRADAPSPGGEGRPGLVFTLGDDGRPKPVPVRLGISDGRFVEVMSGLDEGARVITGLDDTGRAAAPRPGASPANNPFAPGRPQPRSR